MDRQGCYDMNNGVLTKYPMNLVTRQVNDNGLVGWYKPDGVFRLRKMLPQYMIISTECSCKSQEWNRIILLSESNEGGL